MFCWFAPLFEPATLFAVGEALALALVLLLLEEGSAEHEEHAVESCIDHANENWKAKITAITYFIWNAPWKNGAKMPPLKNYLVAENAPETVAC